ncbi:MAG TPA: BON domain-containing protein [Verrucomicrobiae bacterium]|nr:BON domain-containing protein [Verrucomicrobiae bacterium]
MKSISALAIVSVLLLAAGCTSPYGGSDYNTVSSPYIGTQSDQAIESDVRSELDHYGDLAANTSHVRIIAQNGTVTLVGTVPTERDRQMVDAAVRNTAGVVAVNDELQVTYPPSVSYRQPAPVYATPQTVPPAPVIATPNTAPVVTAPPPSLTMQASNAGDQVLADRVVRTLKSDGIAPTDLPSVSVSIVNGAAYVRGTVQNEQEHQALIASVQRTPGVTAVYDQLTVR